MEKAKLLIVDDNKELLKSLVDMAVRGTVERTLRDLFTERELLNQILGLDETTFKMLDGSETLRPLVYDSIKGIKDPYTLIYLYRQCASDYTRNIILDKFKAVAGKLDDPAKENLALDETLSKEAELAPIWEVVESVAGEIINLARDKKGLYEILRGFGLLDSLTVSKSAPRSRKKMSKRQRQKLNKKKNRAAQTASSRPNEKELSAKLCSIFDRNPMLVLSLLEEERQNKGYSRAIAHLAKVYVSVEFSDDSSVVRVDGMSCANLLRDETICFTVVNMLSEWKPTGSKDVRQRKTGALASVICDAGVYTRAFVRLRALRNNELRNAIISNMVLGKILQFLDIAHKNRPF